MASPKRFSMYPGRIDNRPRDVRWLKQIQRESREKKDIQRKEENSR